MWLEETPLLCQGKGDFLSHRGVGQFDIRSATGRAVYEFGEHTFIYIYSLLIACPLHKPGYKANKLS